MSGGEDNTAGKHCQMGDFMRNWAEELLTISQTGIFYTKDVYDRERYQRIAQIAAEMMSRAIGIPTGEVLSAFGRDIGYITPKVSVCGAVFDDDGAILLVQRSDNGLWALPGGWADVGLTPAQVAVKEVREETGLEVEVSRLLGVYDGRVYGVHIRHLYNIVFCCRPLTKELRLSHESLDLGYFAEGSWPPLSPGHWKPIADAFAWRKGTFGEAFFDL